jgi:GT2 family glycosyltransferase
MFSVIVQFRNRAQIMVPCIQSVIDTFRELGQPQNFEYIFTDDCSDAGLEVAPLLLEVRKATTSPVRIVRFKQRQHYTRSCAYTFSMAKGDVLFFSHDMVITPECVDAMIKVGAMDRSNGIVRNCSNYVDCFPEHQVVPPLPIREVRNIRSFSRYVSEHFGLTYTEDPFLTGDAMLIKHEVIEKIGPMDTRYFGYFGDIDFGLRAQHAGYKLVCAKGAWLFHEGAGFYKNESQAKKIDMQIVHQNRMKVVNEAYKLFREKWDNTLPLDYPGTGKIDMDKLRKLSPLPFPLLQSNPPEITPDVADFL